MRIKEELNTNGYIILRNILNDDEIQEYKNEFLIGIIMLLI